MYIIISVCRQTTAQWDKQTCRIISVQETQPHHVQLRQVNDGVEVVAK
jgi:hypothetical protein